LSGDLIIHTANSIPINGNRNSKKTSHHSGFFCKNSERERGIEPPSSAWKAEIIATIRLSHYYSRSPIMLMEATDITRPVLITIFSIINPTPNIQYLLSGCPLHNEDNNQQKKHIINLISPMPNAPEYTQTTSCCQSTHSTQQPTHSSVV
jgi:hypothetical protein